MAGTIVASVINNDTGLFSTQNAYSGIVRAWVCYNASTQTVLNSFNVSSVTYNSTGSFLVNFSTAFSNANYAVAGSCGVSNGNWMFNKSSPTASNCTINCIYSGNSYQNDAGVNAIFIGN
jgi:hypothetical protein